MLIGRPHIHFRSAGSTNTEARRLAAAGAGSGTLVTCDEQTDGRGRQGRAWSSPAGAALAYSVVLRRKIEVPGTLPLQVGVAVCEAVESLAPGVEAQVKWPNDVWIDRRKCAGILVEARPQDGWAVIGIGLNLAVDPADFPPEVREKATSVGHGATVSSAIEALNVSLGKRLDAPVGETLAEFAARDGLRGHQLRWEHGSGTAVGIDPEGNLLVEGAVGCISSLNAGEVHLEVAPL
ncbi:MAG TPA: biotin--[acetyl-CoA-carboxylase] ligase [Solirubrobacterales bacterium]|nr:biotin--[acetyl-CoA-carboxylase] ligase [Solirubrobacterales bacterium]